MDGAREHRSVLVILLAACIAFGGSVWSSFHLDDITLFSDPVVTSPSGWLNLWHPLQTRPLTYLTFWFNYQLGGQKPFGYHVVNLLLHLAVVWLLYGTLRVLVTPTVAWIATAVFAVHPIHTEAVSYIFARAILLCALFCVLATRSWLRGEDERAVGWFTLALLSKEECVTLPLVLLMLRPKLRPVLVMLGLSLLAGIRVLLAIKLRGVLGAGSGSVISPLDYFLTQGAIILRYLRQCVAPYGLTFDPDVALVHPWTGGVLCWIAILISAAVLLVRTRHGGWFVAALLLLLPSSSILPADDLAADRRLYLPMLALAVFAGMLLVRIRQKAIVGALFIGLTALSFARTRVWYSEETLWADTVLKAPRNVRARIYLAREYPPAEALRVLDAAIGIAPTDPRLLIEKGIRLTEMSRLPEALRQFDAALALSPQNAVALNNRAVVYSRLGKQDEAAKDFRRALASAPCDGKARGNIQALGVTPTGRCR